MEGIDDGKLDSLIDGEDDGNSVSMEGCLEGIPEVISDGM